MHPLQDPEPLTSALAPQGRQDITAGAGFASLGQARPNPSRGRPPGGCSDVATAAGTLRRQSAGRRGARGTRPRRSGPPEWPAAASARPAPNRPRALWPPVSPGWPRLRCRGGHRCRPVDRVNAPRRDARDGAASWVAGGVRRWPPVADSGSIQPLADRLDAPLGERGAPGNVGDRLARRSAARRLRTMIRRGHLAARASSIDVTRSSSCLGELVAHQALGDHLAAQLLELGADWPGAASAAAAADRLGSRSILLLVSG